ncbi:MAG: T9SS type B sorting domain-containing protein, partial [Saprospiraceae bacterium]
LVQSLPEKTASFAFCPGDSVLVGAEWLSGAGTYAVRVSAMGGGCDTIYQVSISETPAIFASQTITICTGDSALVFGQWVAAPAVLSQTFASAAGCDSVQEIRVLVQSLPEKTASFAFCPGDSVLVGAEWLSGAGTYSVRVSAMGGGCDTIYQVSISETPAIFASQTITICAGDSVAVFGQWVAENAVLNQTFTSAAGCDSVQEIRVLVTPLPEKTASFVLCPGDSVLVGAEWLSSAGTYAVRVSANGGGCDTVYQVSISETPAVFASQTVTICAGDSVQVFGQWVAENAVRSQTFTSAAGCDSVQEIRVLVQSLPEKTASFALCLGDSVLVGSEWLSGAGTYAVRVSASGGGCDTIVRAHVSVLPNVYRTDTLTICPGDSVLINGEWIAGAGVRTLTFIAANGCDSLHILSVAVSAVPVLPVPGDTVLKQGQALVLDLGLNPTDWSVQWLPAALFFCDTCSRTTVSTRKTVEVEVVYTNRAGCTFSHHFLIEVQEWAKPYVPNVFSPDNNGSNDSWEVVSPHGGVFEEVSVWSRWGELVAIWRDVPRVDWDGTYRGRALDAAVFAWYIRYRDAGGGLHLLKGDVTLLR